MGEYLESLVGVFADVRRVLKRSGTLWVNMGDCYVTDGGSGVQGLTGQRAGRRQHSGEDPRRGELAVKNLMGLPWRLAIALQDSGWFLRRDHVWEKPSATPESAKDRATTAHEYVFLLTKSAQYYFDPFAVMERTTGGTHSRGTSGRLSPKSTNDRHTTGIKNNSTYCRKHDGRFAMRNQRSVWRIAAQPNTARPARSCTPAKRRSCSSATTRIASSADAAGWTLGWRTSPPSPPSSRAGVSRPAVPSMAAASCAVSHGFGSSTGALVASTHIETRR